MAPRVGDTCLESQNKRLSVSKFILRIMNDLRVQKGSCSLGTQIFLFMCPFFFFFLRFFSHIDHFLNLIEFVTILFLFYVLAFRL